LKKVLIISPSFPPLNTADMQRVRQTLPYLRQLGWEPVIITVDEQYAESYSRDILLMETVPADTRVYKVKAWKKKFTSKIGLGSLSLRSYFFLQKKGDELLRREHFDLVYFSTTYFHAMALGPRWKRKFGVPFVLDIQDPWRSDFYLDKPRNQRPPKFIISYNLDKYLEAKTVPHADGIISVSQGYCDTFLQRYPTMRKEQFRVIPFGAFPPDFDIMKKFVDHSDRVKLHSGKTNVVYVGRGGHDMRFALDIVFNAFKKGLEKEPEKFSRLHFWFVGTSYATEGQGVKTILPVAESAGIGEFVTEITDRIPYFETLFLLGKADMVLVPGSIDQSYTASKIYPYVLAKRPLLAVFHKSSSVVRLFESVDCGKLVTFDNLSDGPGPYVGECLSYFSELLAGDPVRPEPSYAGFTPFLAESRAREQVDFFNIIVKADINTK
jgi:Glycosyltransferase Family 4